MDYTKFSSETKNIICRFLGIVPSKLFLQILYRIKTGRKLSLTNPQTYSEKINWMKVYDHNPLYTKLADKYEVRDYVIEKIGEKYLIPLIGVWDSFDEINFSELPNKFVLKCTHDFGSVILIEDSSRMKVEEVKKQINSELKYNFFYRGREWAYKDIKPRIIAEKFMQDEFDRLVDYKFFCFAGKVEYMFIATGRGKDLRFDFFDKDFNHIDVTNGVPTADIMPVKPKMYDEMIRIAELLAADIPNVRVDLYQIKDAIYFSEMTFYHNGGMVAFEPYEKDIEFGRNFIMRKYKNEITNSVIS